MKDVFGQELAVGDVVAFMEPGYTYALKTGTIVRFTPQKLAIKWRPDFRGEDVESLKFPKQVAKRPPE